VSGNADSRPGGVVHTGALTNINVESGICARSIAVVMSDVKKTAYGHASKH